MKARNGLSAALGAAILMTSATTASANSHGLATAIIGGLIFNEIAKGSRRAPRHSGISSAQRQQNRDVQSALNTFGFPVGAVDGSLGRNSRAGISNYQSYMGWPRTGYLNDQERAALVGGMQRYNSGGASAYPEVIANEGVQGLLKAFNDPNYANRYRQNTVPQNSVPQLDNNDRAGDGLVYPEDPLGNLLDGDDLFGQTSYSMATYCELVAGMTQTNNGTISVNNMVDPDQALGEQFCEARSYAMTESQTQIANSRATAEQLTNACVQIGEKMIPASSALGTQDFKFVAGKAQEISNVIFKGNMNKSAGFGKICLGVGYRQDDAEIALGGAMSLLAAGQVPYAEIMGHHLRQGFGVNKAPDAAKDWYDAALSSMEQGATPVFLPSKTAERNAIINAAINANSLIKISDDGLTDILDLDFGGN